MAPNTDITAGTWQTQTITFAFPGDTIVDDAGYLDIDLFADATANTPTSSGSVDFRIDHSSLAVTDPTRIQAP